MCSPTSITRARADNPEAARRWLGWFSEHTWQEGRYVESALLRGSTPQLRSVVVPAAELVTLVAARATAESLRRMMELLARTPSDPPFWAEFAHRLVRLVFAIVRLNGWQPAELGGDGTVAFTALDGNPELFDAAMRDVDTPHGQSISRFLTAE